MQQPSGEKKEEQKHELDKFKKVLREMWLLVCGGSSG